MHECCLNTSTWEQKDKQINDNQRRVEALWKEMNWAQNKDVHIV